jgi:putative hemolysin
VTESQLFFVVLFGWLLVLNFLTSAARGALEHFDPSRLPRLGEARSESQSAQIMPALSSFYYTIAGLHWMQTLFHLGLAAAAGSFFFPILNGAGENLWLIALLIASALAVAWVEWAVHQLAARRAEQWGPNLMPVARLLTAPIYPLLLLTLRVSPKKIPGENQYDPEIEEEIKHLVNGNQPEMRLEKDERKMIYSIFRLSDTLAREIMIPRMDMLALDVQTSLSEAVDILLATGFSRVPVYEETIDNVLGVLYTKDLLRVWREGTELTTLRSLLRQAYFVPEAKKVDELLAEMQSRRVHMAVVVDEYGGVAGVVTLEDIVEEIVGEIQDEYDQLEELPYQQINDNEYVFQGRVDLDDFNEIVGSYLPSDEAETIGGFIYNRVGRVPASGESIQVDDVLLTVEQVSGRRIRKVRANRVQVDAEEKKEESNANK